MQTTFEKGTEFNQIIACLDRREMAMSGYEYEVYCGYYMLEFTEWRIDAYVYKMTYLDEFGLLPDLGLLEGR